MTTNLLSVIEQQQKALNICIAKHYDLAEDVRIGDAIAAGQQALEQTQVEAQSCANCKNNAWPFGSCDECGVQNDDPASGSNWEGVEQSPDCDICGSDCPLHPQAAEPAPSTDICQNCAGQGWEPSVYKGKVPCSFCQPAPSTAGQAEPEWNDENVIAYCIARGISSAKAFTVGATHPQATHPAPRTAREPVLWQYRWTNPSGDSYQESQTDWKQVEPTWNQTVQQKCEELLAYRFGGKPTYEVRGLYTTPPSAVPVVEQLVEELKSATPNLGDKRTYHAAIAAGQKFIKESKHG